MQVDDHWWFANTVLFHADRDNGRYGGFLKDFDAAWTFRQAKGSPESGLRDVDGLSYEVRSQRFCFFILFFG